MTGESANWRAFADRMFSSFGDVVKDAVLTHIEPGSSFDTTKGKYTETTSIINTKLVWSKDYEQLRGYNLRREAEELLYREGDQIAILRGSDFVTAGQDPEPGDTVTVDGRVLKVKRTWPDSPGVKAIFYVHTGT